MKISHRIGLAGALALIGTPVLAGAAWTPGDKVWGKPANAPWSECMINTVRADPKGAVIYDANCRIFANGTYVPTKEVFTPAQTRAFSAAPPPEPTATSAASPRPARSTL